MLALEWQPITGCSYISAGCANCKTVSLAGPALREHFEREGLVKRGKSGPVWTGAMRFSEERLAEPLGLATSALVHVVPHGDLFHENVPDAWIDRVFDVIERCPQHAFQVLTKRAARQRAYMTRRYSAGREPPPNLSLGISAERQREADERVTALQQTPAALRYVTLYPVLGPIDLCAMLLRGGIAVVVAGEEPERPADPAWMWAIEGQCAAAGVPFHRSNKLVGEQRPAGDGPELGCERDVATLRSVPEEGELRNRSLRLSISGLRENYSRVSPESFLAQPTNR